MIEVFGARIRQARMLRQMTAKSVVEVMGWSNVRQSKLEKAATTTLSVEQVNAFASLFRFPARFFSTKPQSRVTAGELLFRAPKSMTVGEQEFLAAFASLAGDFLADLDTVAKLPPVRIPSIEGGAVPATAAEAAGMLRETMGVDPDEPLDDLMYEAERLGAPVIVRRRMAGEWYGEFWEMPAARDEKHLGYSSWVGRHRDRPLVVLRETQSWERTRFTVAHELGHLVLHSRACGAVSAAEEADAHRFAAELLAPAAAIAGELPAAMSLLNLKPLKDKWGISLGSLIRHLRESGLIDAGRAKMLTTQLYSRINPETGHTWGRTEPGWNERSAERPRLLRKWTERCYGSAAVPMLTARDSMIFPPDLLDWFLATQRGAPDAERHLSAVPAASSPGGGQQVIDLERFRRIRANVGGPGVS